MRKAYIAHVEVRNSGGGWDTWERITMLTDEQADECRSHSVCMLGVVYRDRLMAREGSALFVKNSRLRPVKLPKRRWWQFWRKG